MSANTAGPTDDPAGFALHRFGGQAVIEGVMMRGADRWSVAVRRPGGDIWLECREMPGGRPRRWQRLPLVRGCHALTTSMSIGSQALRISAAHAIERTPADRADDQRAGDQRADDQRAGDQRADDQRVGDRHARDGRAGDEQRVGDRSARDRHAGDGPTGGRAADSADGPVRVSLVLALLLFVAIFVLLPLAATTGLDALLGGGLDGVAFHLADAMVRVLVFLGYLWLISRLPDIRRVFQYHGAEHQTIAAWEDGQVLDPAVVGRYPTLHVRCGTNFLVLVMLLAAVVFTIAGMLLGAPADAGIAVGFIQRAVLRVALLPVVAGLAYEGLRLGAAYGDRLPVRVLMRPGLWLQLITTRRSSPDQVEVAIRAFEALLAPERRAGRIPDTLDSVVTVAPGAPQEGR